MRDRADRCPGVLRPWIAEDGALIRLRLIGGLLDADALRRLARIAETFGDGRLYLTTRANLQIRGIAHTDGCLAPELAEAVHAAGLLPSPSHDRVRNIMVSPLTGLASGLASEPASGHASGRDFGRGSRHASGRDFRRTPGRASGQASGRTPGRASGRTPGRTPGHAFGRADLRPVAAELDRLLCADPALADLPGKFLFCLDDGRGDVTAHRFDLGLTALDTSHAQIQIGTEHRGPVVTLAEAPALLTGLARNFLNVRETAWHVDELPKTGLELLDAPSPRDERTPTTTPASHDERTPTATPASHDERTPTATPSPRDERTLTATPASHDEWTLTVTPSSRDERAWAVSSVPPFGGIVQDDGRRAEHLAVPDGVLAAGEAVRLAALSSRIIVTPWRSVILPDQEPF